MSGVLWLMCKLLLIAATAFALYKATHSLLLRLPQSGGEFSRDTVRKHTLQNALGSTLKVLIVIAAILTALGSLGINLTAILTGAGVVGLGISLAAQNIFKDFLNGFFILLEDQYGVGDHITVGTFSGTVEKFNFRATVLRDQEGRHHILPNSSIGQITVAGRDWAKYVVDIPISHHADIELALTLVHKDAVALTQDAQWSHLLVDEGYEVLGVQKLAPGSTLLRVLLKTKPKEQWRVGREYLRRVKHSFSHAGIDFQNA